MKEEVRRRIVERLSNPSNLLYPNLAPGGIYDRKLQREQGPGQTKNVWTVDPADPAKIARLRPAIVVMGPNEVEPPNGPAYTEDLVLRNGFLRVFMYAPRDAQGKEALDQIDLRVRQLLNGWQTQLSHGYPMTVGALDAVESTDSDEFSDALVTYRRYVAEYLRPAF